jgi:hypothetical protein
MLTLNKNELYTCEGNLGERVQSMRMLVLTVHGCANQYWAVVFLARVPDILAGASRYAVEAMTVCPNLPLSERIAMFSLLLQLTDEPARAMIQMIPPAGVNSMQSDGIMTMIALATSVSDRAIPMQVTLLADIRTCQFSGGDPRITVNYFENQFSTLDVITPYHSRLSESDSNKMVWHVVPSQSGMGIWNLVRNYTNTLCGDNIPSRHLVYAVMTRYYTHNIVVASTPSNDVRHVNMMGKLVGVTNKGAIMGGHSLAGHVYPQTHMEGARDGDTYDGYAAMEHGR